MNRRIWTYSPTTTGGHARYTQSLMEGLSRVAPPGDRLALLTGRGLDARYRSDLYETHAVLPGIRPRGEVPSALAWGAGRAAEYWSRDRTARRYLTGLGADLVHVQEMRLGTAVPFSRGLRRRGTRVVMTVHNVRPHTYLLPEPVHRRLNVAGWRACDALVVHTEGLREEILREAGGALPPVFVVPHGVWRAGALGGEPLRAPAAGPTVLFYGTIRENKGLHLLLDALRKLPDVRLVVAGSTVEPAYFEREVAGRVAALRALGHVVETRFEFVPDEEVAAVFADADVLALPYTAFAAQSGVLYDAVSHDVPVVASRQGGPGEFLEAYPIGDTFDGTPSDLARALRRVLSGDTAVLRAHLARARAELSWDAVARRTYSVYDEVLGAVGEGPRPTTESAPGSLRA